jgi:hypothetical protein
MFDLKKGWNGYDADPPSVNCIALTNYLLHCVLPEPRKVTPSCVGGIAIIYDGIYIEVDNDLDIVSCFGYSSINEDPGDILMEHDYFELGRKIRSFLNDN